MSCPVDHAHVAKGKIHQAKVGQLHVCLVALLLDGLVAHDWGPGGSWEYTHPRGTQSNLDARISFMRSAERPTLHAGRVCSPPSESGAVWMTLSPLEASQSPS